MNFDDPSAGHRRWWSRCWGVLVALGIGLSLLMWPVTTVVGSFMVVTSAAGMLLFLARAEMQSSNNGVPAPDRRRLFSRAMWIGAVVVAAWATADVSVSAAALLVFLAAASSPWLVRFVTARAHATVAEADGFEVTGRSPDELSNAELCLAWRHSFLGLQSPGSAARLMRIVELRRSYLDELDRRSPRALEAWLASGASAASGPDRYLPDAGRQHPGAA